jgi:DNA polymerase III epsilon subunit-like protein
LARALIARDEIPNCKLSTLAIFFETEVKPTHRALDDANTTVDVFYGLLERAGSRNVTTLNSLLTLSKQRQSREKNGADALHWRIKEEYVEWSTNVEALDVPPQSFE